MYTGKIEVSLNSNSFQQIFVKINYFLGLDSERLEISLFE